MSVHQVEEEEEEEDEFEDPSTPGQMQSIPLLPLALTWSKDDDVTFSGFNNSEAPGTSGMQQRNSEVQSHIPSFRRVSRQSRSADRQADMELDMVGLSRESIYLTRQLLDVLCRIPMTIETLTATLTEEVRQFGRPKSSESSGGPRVSSVRGARNSVSSGDQEYEEQEGWRSARSSLLAKSSQPLSGQSQEPDDRVTPQGVFYRDIPHLINADGNYLFCRYWMPKTQPRALVMLIHSAGEHCGRYKRIIAMLLNQSLLVFSHDHIGHGQSEGPRMMVPDFRIYIRDCLQHIDMFKRRYPMLKLYLLSQSMGGLIAVYILYDRPGDIAGAIFMSPLLLMNPESAKPLKMFIAKVMYHMLPNLPMGYIDPRLTSRDESQVQAYIDDPLIYHGPVRVGFAFEVLNALTKIEKMIPSITAPMLILHGDADSLSDIRGSYILYGKVGSQDKTFKVMHFSLKMKVHVKLL
uniref:monoglyceride lipase-like n=1 Tax=Pristiophorus japonicus TaxID=55135 RepID=UPI00398F868D